jgi:O-acetyl-ADP-ribose deacetylase (regulator of RNase III)
MTDKNALVSRLIAILVQYVPGLQNQVEAFSADYFAQRALLRGLMNMHKVENPLSEEFFALQDELLAAELKEKNLVNCASLAAVKLNPMLSLHQGDITSLCCDAIVNAATPLLQGCFQAGHNCIDNCIHSAAGLQLRYECARILGNRVAKEGSAIISHAFNLPCRFVIHVVAPKVGFEVTSKERSLLASCYTETLKVARKNGVKSLAFCPIGTGALGYPAGKAVKVAVETVQNDLEAHHNDLKVVFAVDKESDYHLYDAELNPNPKKKDDELHPFFNINLI